VVGMAAMSQSIHSIPGLLEGAPCETSLRHHLKKLDMDELEEKNPVILKSRNSRQRDTPGSQPGKSY